MKSTALFLVLSAALLSFAQQKPVVHLPPHRDIIDAALGGKMLELENAPPILHLPPVPQKLDENGNPWIVDVKNAGPAVVTVMGKAQFSVKIAVGQTVHIYSNGTAYSLKYNSSMTQ
jgi:hypothetical protein